MSDKQEMIDNLKTIVKPYIQNQEAFNNLHEDTDFINDLKINSANLVDVILDIEDKYDIELDNESMDKMLNVKAALEVINDKVSEKVVVGNDIIDIDETRRSTLWERARFVDKVFTKKEQQFISTSVDPFKTVWHLWSMKESAYKVFIQAGGNRFFSPTKLDCTIETYERGKVRIEKTSIKTNTEFNSNYIFTAAILDREEVESRIFQLADNSSKAQSVQMQKKVLNAFAEKNSLNKAELEIRKTTAGVPKIYYKNKACNISFSITHHGNYGAYSLLIE